MIEQINFKSVLDFTKMSVNEIEKLQNIKDETDKFAFVRKKKLRKVHKKSLQICSLNHLL